MSNYLVIHDWMLKLGLNSNELLVYSLVYGFNSNGKKFIASVSYIANFLNISTRSVITILKKLTEKGLLLKIKNDNNKRLIEYKIGNVDNLHIDNFNIENREIEKNKNNIFDNPQIENVENLKVENPQIENIENRNNDNDDFSHMSANFSHISEKISHNNNKNNTTIIKEKKYKKKKVKNEGETMIEDYIKNEVKDDFKDNLFKWLKYKQRKFGYITIEEIRAFYCHLLTLSQQDGHKAEEIVNYSISGGYRNIYPLPTNSTKTTKAVGYYTPTSCFEDGRFVW